MEIRYVGGVFGGNIRPTPFLCLTLKMLQIQPEKDIVVEFIKNEEFKYVRALGAFYLRLTGTSIDCYKYLEPLYNDNRKLRFQNRSGQYEILHMDEYIDQLLRSDRVCDIILPRIQKRHILEENNELEPKVSALDDDLDDDGSDDDHNSIEEAIKQELYDTSKKEHSSRRDRNRSVERKERGRSPDRRERERSTDRRGRYTVRNRDRDRDYESDLDERKDKDREREKEKERERERERERDRDRDRERDRGRRNKDRYSRNDRDDDRYHDHGRHSESDKKRDRRDRDRDRNDRKYGHDYDDRDRRRHN